MNLEMLSNPYLNTVLITLIPLLELRLAIPYAILVADIPWFTAALIVFLINVVLGVIMYLILEKLVLLLCRIKLVDKLYKKILVRTQNRIHKYVEKYGEWGLAVFIAIPLPGSGVYTGALAAYILGLSFRKFVVAVVIGVLIATALVTAIVMTGSEVFSRIFGIGAGI